MCFVGLAHCFCSSPFSFPASYYCLVYGPITSFSSRHLLLKAHPQQPSPFSSGLFVSNFGGISLHKSFPLFVCLVSLLEVFGTDATRHFLFLMSWMNWITWVMIGDGMPSCTHISYHVTTLFDELSLLFLFRLAFGAQPHPW